MKGFTGVSSSRKKGLESVGVISGLRRIIADPHRNWHGGGIASSLMVASRDSRS